MIDVKKYKMKLLLLIIILSFQMNCATAKMNPQPNSDVSVDTDHLYATVKALTEIEPSRNHENIASLNKAADYIKNEFVKFGYTPVEQHYRHNDLMYKNIIASFGPEEAPRFIIGAHYDVFETQSGADDNASGIAGLLELSRLFRVNTPSLKIRIDFVAFTLEEPPYFKTQEMGSYIHAKSLDDQHIKVIGMASLEMIGFFTDAEKSQQYPSVIMKPFYPSIGNYIAVVGNFKSASLVRHFKKNLNQTTINVKSLSAPSFITGVDFSDHMNYWKFNHNAIMITDTAFYRNPNYHEATDTIDTLDFMKMAEVVKGVYWALVSLGD